MSIQNKPTKEQTELLYLYMVLSDVEQYCTKVKISEQLASWKAGHKGLGFDKTNEVAARHLQGAVAKYNGEQLKSIYCVAKSECNTPPDKYYGLQRLSLGNEFYGAGKEENGYWSDFGACLGKVELKSAGMTAENILTVLQQYAYCLPSPIEGVSLYEYSKIKAGLGVCLYMNGGDEKDILLVGGSVSGIQDFIYGIISKSAAKNLKGRSFYLQLLVDTVKQYILDELGLFEGNVVYSSGGNFYILAPNGKDVKDKLTEADKSLALDIYELHGTNLYSTFAWIDLPLAELTGLCLQSRWDALMKEVTKKKQQKYRYPICKEYSNFFEPSEVGGEAERDVITGEELVAHATKVDFPNKGERLGYVSALTNKQIELGKMLRGVKMIVMPPSGSSIPHLEAKDSDFKLSILGYNHYFLDGYARIAKDKNARIAHINGEAWDVYNDENYHYSVYYGGNDYPADEYGDIKDFSDLAGDGKFKRLGVLRMDVDGLGNTFRNPFCEKATLASYTALSGAMDYFFKGRLNHIWRSRALYSNNSQIIYSGGDDLFIVGRWDAIIELAKAIHEQFNKWVLGHQDFTISGGIAMVTHKFPIMKAAEMAGEAEHKSKDYSIKSIKKSMGEELLLEKNAITFLGQTFNWVEEFGYVEKRKETVRQLMSSGVPDTFFMRLASICELLNTNELKTQITLRYHLAYTLARAYSRIGEPMRSIKDEFMAYLNQTKHELITNSYLENGQKVVGSNYSKIMWTAIHWAFLEKRSEEKEAAGSK